VFDSGGGLRDLRSDVHGYDGSSGGDSADVLGHEGRGRIAAVARELSDWLRVTGLLLIRRFIAGLADTASAAK